MHTLREAYPSSDEGFSMDVKTEEETEVLGEKFIYRTGTIHVEELDESADLNYSAYFGIMPFSKYSDDITPICWIAFTESNDPQVLNEIDEIAKNAAEMAVYDEY